MGTLRSDLSSGQHRSALLRRLAFAAALVVHLVVLYAPYLGQPDAGFPGVDKVVHVAVFAAVTYTGLRAGLRPRWFLAAVVAHALASELVQEGLLPGRGGDPWDAVADLAGIALGHVGSEVQRRTVAGDVDGTFRHSEP